MSKFLFKIRETFEFEALGLVAEADIKYKDARLNNGDEIEPRPPPSAAAAAAAGDSPVITKVAGITMFNPSDPERVVSFSLPKDLNKKDVPVGTEVWSHP